MEQRYNALRTISVMQKVIAITIAIAGIVAGTLIIIGSLGAIAVFEPIGVRLGGFFRTLIGGGVVLFALVNALALFARAELIDVQLSVEEHTREIAVLARLSSDDQVTRRARLLQETPLRWQ